MTFDIVAGMMITVAALSLIIFLTIRNRRITERIPPKRSKTIPQTKNELADSSQKKDWKPSITVSIRQNL